MKGIENAPAVPDELPVEGTCADRVTPVREAAGTSLPPTRAWPADPGADPEGGRRER
jgi:hypothetical protein